MKPQLKPLNEQTLVITGASSGIGLATARLAANYGAKLVLTARSDEELNQLEQEINASGGQAIHVVADVGREQDVRHVAEVAIQRLGGFDTWINNAGVSAYGRCWEIPLEDQRRIFDTNYWGVVHGSLVALEHLRQRPGGGAIINIGSTLSDRAIPLQGPYCATKRAVKAFSDSLRMGIEEAGFPVSVTVIKPASIDTPYIRHAGNYMANEPQYPPPVYEPQVVAKAILHAAQKPQRDVYVGSAARMFGLMEKYAPRIADRVMESTMFQAQQRTDRPGRERQSDALHSPAHDLSERGGHEGHVASSSLYTQASLHPLATGAILLGAAGLAIGALLQQAGNGRNRLVARARSRWS